MSKKKSRLKLAQEQAESAIKKTNEKIGELGTHTSQLYDELNTIQELFDVIRNVPNEKRLEYEKLKLIRLNWKQQAEKIESDYKNAAVKNAGKGAAGVGVGVAVAALGPTAAMGIATTFGIASTGTAISTLSGAAATNAALAWLGGGALAAGGGGMAAGDAFLALAGPVGWAIAGVALVGSGLLLWKRKSDQNRLEDIFTLISKRDVKSYKLAIIEINERISRIKDESQKINCAIEGTRIFGLDFNLMTDAQQYELGSYVNLMNSSTQLLVNPIIGLQPKYDNDDLMKYIDFSKKKYDNKQKSLIVSLSNLLYKIKLDEKDETLLWKSFKGNKKFLSSIEMSKKDFEFSIIETVTDALKYKYRSENMVAITLGDGRKVYKSKPTNDSPDGSDISRSFYDTKLGDGRKVYKPKATNDSPDGSDISRSFYDTNQKEDKEKRKYLLIFGMVAVVCIALIICIGMIVEQIDGKIEVNYSSSDFEGSNYEDVISQLEKQGFTNIKTNPDDDLIIGWIKKDEEVEKVEIDGYTKFSSSSRFLPDVEIVITYHTFSDD